MTVAEYFDQVYWPVRTDSDSPIGIAASTAATEITCWRHKGSKDREPRGILDGEIGSTRMRSLDDALWERWQNAQRHLSPRSKAIRRNVYAALLGYARRMGHIDYRPEFFRIRGSTKRTRPQVDPLTLDETIALLDVTEPMRRAMWAVGVGQGLRPAKLVRVQWSDIHWRDRLLAVRGTKTDASAAVIPMTPLAFRELRLWWVAEGQPDEGHAFTWRGKAFRQFKKALASDAKAAGIERHVTPNLLRHSFATLAWSLGIEMEVARRIMRHTDDTMIRQVYMRPRPVDLVNRVAAFDL